MSKKKSLIVNIKTKKLIYKRKHKINKMRKFGDLVKENESLNTYNVFISLNIEGEINATDEDAAKEEADNIINNMHVSNLAFSIENWTIDNVVEVDNSVQENIDNGLSNGDPEVEALNKISAFVKETTEGLSIGQKQYVAQNLLNSIEFLMNPEVSEPKSEYPAMETETEETPIETTVAEVQPTIEDEPTVQPEVQPDENTEAEPEIQPEA